MQQVAVSCVQLDDSKARVSCASRSVGKGVDDTTNPIGVESLRDRIGLAKWNATRGDRAPTTVTRRHDMRAFPGWRRTRFSTCMRELNAGNRRARLDETRTLRQTVDMFITPDAEVLGRDPAFGRHRRRLGDDESCSANGTTAQVHEVP